jgi:hypothetical protein
MEGSRTTNKNLTTILISTAIPVFLYLVILIIPVAASVSGVFWSYSLPCFLIALLLYYAGFRLPGTFRWLASACLTMLLLGLTLSFLWHSGYSDDKIIAGLLPFRDGFDYYNGANWLLSGQAIKTINEGAAWRPLYPGFLSALLWITGRNLQWALAIQVGVAGLCFSLSACQVRNRLGAAAAALYLTLLYFYIQPLIGTAYTETLGLALGCLGFVLLWEAAETLRWPPLILGLIILMIAVSERAGAFFIFPLLALWAGWAFRGQGRFSVRYAGLALATAAVTYVIVNTAYSKLVVEPGGLPFGNFAFTLYGQVVGGAGYHKAFEDLGVRNPAVILRAAEQFFLAHPLGFFVGAAKAYRDFFSPQSGVLGFGPGGGDILVWIAGSALLLFGIYDAARKIRTPESSLWMAAFIGVFLSVPFLPPIDGGIRIYASTMPFIYILPAVAATGLRATNPADAMRSTLVRPSLMLSVVLAALTLIAPVLIRHTVTRPVATAQICPANQAPFAATLSAGSYVDLVPDGLASCGSLPEVCMRDFQKYSKSNDPSDAQAYDELVGRSGSSVIRVFPANDMVSGRAHLFVGSTEVLKVRGSVLISGCATETQIKGRPSLYTIQAVVPAGLGQ